MQQHRDAAQRAAVHRKLKDDAKMAYVQTILQSVQVIQVLTCQLSSIFVLYLYSYTTEALLKDMFDCSVLYKYTLVLLNEKNHRLTLFSFM